MVPACGNTRFGFVRRGVQSVFGPVCTSPVSNLRPRAPSCQRQLPAWHRQVASVCSESRCLYSSDAGPSTIYKPSSCTWQYCSLAEVCCIRQVLPFKSGRAATRSHTCLCVINSSKSAGALPFGHVTGLNPYTVVGNTLSYVSLSCRSKAGHASLRSQAADFSATPCRGWPVIAAVSLGLRHRYDACLQGQLFR